MPSRRILAGALALCLSLLRPTSAPAFALGHRLVPQFSEARTREEGILVADVDGDGNDEVLICGRGFIVCEDFASGFMRVKWQCNLPRPGAVQTPIDIDGNGSLDLPVIFTQPDSTVTLTCYRSSDSGSNILPFLQFGPFFKGCGIFADGHRGAIEVLGAFDAGDGQRDLYLSEIPFVPGTQPRRLWCIDPTHGDTAWCFAAAPCVNAAVAVRGRAGGQVGLVVTTYSPCNRFHLDGMADSLSYLFGLTPRGKPVWTITSGGAFSTAVVDQAALDRSGSTEILMGVRDRSAGKPRDLPASAVVIDPQTGALLRRSPLRVGTDWLKAEDLDGDGSPEILIVGQDGHLYCLDHDLNLRWKRDDGTYSWLPFVADLEGNGSKEIVCGGLDWFVVLSAGGRKLAERAMERATVPFLARVGRANRLVVTSDRAFEVLAVTPIAPVAPVLPLGATAAAMAIGLLVWLRRRGGRAAERLVRAREAQERLLESMVAFGHAGASLKALDRLRWWLINWERVAVQSGPDEPRFPAVLADYERLVLPDLIALLPIARRASVATHCWKSLVERALSARNELRPVVAQPSRQADGRVQRALHALDEVDRCLAGIRAHLRRAFRAPIAEIVRKTIENRREELSRRKARCRVHVQGDPDPSGFSSPVVLEKVLANLVDNSLRATSGVAAPEIEITLEPEGAHHRIDVHDNGCGIPAEKREAVFDRHYSTKPEGGGFGLHFAREALARYEGRIFVRSSEPGSGTTFRILLRASEAENGHGEAGPEGHARRREDGHPVQEDLRAVDGHPVQDDPRAEERERVGEEKP